MKKIIFVLLIFLSGTFSLNAESNVKRIYEGSPDAKITILAFESLTCSHCANFHKDVYPDLKRNFIDNGLVKLEYRNFPLDLAAFNAAKEEALDNFLDKKLSFLGMADVVKATIDELTAQNLLSSDVEIDAVMEIDSYARLVAKMFVDKI